MRAMTTVRSSHDPGGKTLIIVADHTKFGRSAMIPVAQLDAADVVVSDSDLASEYVELLRSNGVEVLLA
jgi:DeoR/GlpR family transcriptional regulator of sugar metabolism